jgi:hypothetical protein
MSGLLMWACVLVGTAILGVLGWAGMNWYGTWAKQRDEIERLRLQEEWKRRAAERKARQEGTTQEEQEAGDNPPLY